MSLSRVLLVLGTVAAAVGLILVLFVPAVPGKTDLAFTAGGATGIGLAALL